MGANLENQDDNFIKLNPSTRTYGEQIATYLLNKGFRKFSCISDKQNDPYCPTFVEGYSQPISKAGGQHIQVTFDGSERVNYLETATRALNQGTEAILICASALDTALITQHLKRNKPDTFIMSSPWGISRELIENGGTAIDGLHFFMSVEYGNQSPRNRTFEELFMSRFNQEAGFASIFNYEAMTMLISALRENPGGTPSEIKKILLDTPMHRGVQEDFRLDREGDPVKPLFLHRIENGEFRRMD
jgi:branched-chain amino acid transport system substrate-binding protein